MRISLFQGILLAVFIGGALLGLFVFATFTNTNSGANQIGTVVIWGTLPEADMTAALAAAAQADQTLKNVTYVQKDPATFKGELTAAIATAAAPDLILISQEQIATLASVISPIPASTLPESTFTSTFAAEDSLFASPSGGYFGVPVLIDPLVLFANRAILSSEGIAQPPATWEALAGLVSRVAQVGKGSSITRALAALGTYSNTHNARAILSALFLQTGVPLSTRTSAGTITANLGTDSTASGLPAGQAVLRFYTQFSDPTKVSYTWNASLPDSQQAFLTGDLALYLGFASEARYFSEANPNLDFEVAPIPQPATATVRTTYGLAYALATPRGAPNASGAYQAAALLSGTAFQQALASATGLAPASRAALAAQPGDPALAVAYASALYAKGWLSPAPADTDTVFSGMITGVTSGRYGIDNALTSALRALNAQLQ